jgi:hypothetical protein
MPDISLDASFNSLSSEIYRPFGVHQRVPLQNSRISPTCYMVGIVVLVSAIIKLFNLGKGVFQNKKWVASMFDFTYLGFEWILAKFVT